MHTVEWRVYGERPIYQNPWVNLWLVDVQQPDGRRWEHHVVRMRHLSVAAVVDDRKRVLMIWRHRFITDSWAWELPMGLIEDDETPIETAAREVEEETGWRPNALRPLAYSEAANGITDSKHYLFRADGGTHIGEPTDVNEADKVEWIPLTRIPSMINAREIVSSASLISLMAVLLNDAGIQVTGQ